MNMSGKSNFKIPRALLEPSAALAVEGAAARGGRVGVACSGGADSVCALMWAASVFRGRGKNLFVLHFNHRERVAADSDAAFVGGLARSLGAEFVLGAAESAPERISEDILRKMRLAFFASKFAELGLSAIVQGHNSGDVAETLVMRLMRGSGSEGMSAPRPLSHFRGALFARPLLRMSKAEIKKILSDAKAEWREDETNSSPDFLRNRLRAEIIPAIDALCPGEFAGSALRSRALFQEDSDFAERVFGREIAAANPRLELSNSGNPPRKLLIPREFASDPAFVRRAAAKLLSLNSLAGKARSGCADSFVWAAVSKGFARVCVGGGLEMFFDGSSVRLEKPEPVSDWEIPLKSGRNALPGGRVLRVEKVSLTKARFESITSGENDDARRAYIDLSATGGLADGALIARSRRDGDRYPPLGSRSPKKLKEIFNSKKIPVWERKPAFVVCNLGGDILWSPGLPPSELFKAAGSRSVIELTCENI